MEASRRDLDRFRGYLHFLARAGLRRPMQGKVDPSDIVQDTLLKAYESLDQLRAQTDREIAAWLRQILVRKLANLHRDLHSQKRDVRRERSLQDLLQQSTTRLGQVIADGRPSHVDQVEGEEALLRMADAFSRLPESQQQVLWLQHWEGLPLAEIGRLLGRSPGAVASLLHRGMKSLRKELGDGA